MRLRLAALAAALAFVSPSAAQEKERPRRLIETNLPEKPIPAPAYLTPVIAPTARTLVVNDALGLMLVAHRPPKPKETPKPGTTWPQLTYARLDAAGVPGPFKPIALPKSASLAAQANYPLAFAFHPKLPLLYVWQDIEPIAARTDASDAVVAKEFDHILIYHLDGAEPELLFAFGRGERFNYGQSFAAIALDPAASRLFVGNLSHPGPKTAVNAAVGCVRLATDGLPEFDPEARTPVATDRATRVAAARALAPKVTPNAGLFRMTPLLNGGHLWDATTGLGMVAFSRDHLVFGGSHGPITWDMANRRAEMVVTYTLPIYRPANLGNLDRMAAHPTLPVLYGSIIAIDGATWTDSFLWRYEHAEGFLTMIPQRMNLLYFRAGTPPVFVTKHNKIALGGEKRVGFFGLNAEGWLTKDRTEVEVNAPRVWGLAYSEKFDKLYVAVDEPAPPVKEPKK